MPITITFHIFGFTVTIRIKGKTACRGALGYFYYSRFLRFVKCAEKGAPCGAPSLLWGFREEISN